MYQQHRKHLRKASERKHKEQVARMRKTGVRKFKVRAPSLSEKQRVKRKSLLNDQKEAMDRLFHGVGTLKKEEDKEAEVVEERPEQSNDSGRRNSQRGANWKGRKKSVVIKALQKEKLQMLQYLDKLQMPLEIKNEDHELLHE